MQNDENFTRFVDLDEAFLTSLLKKKKQQTDLRMQKL